MQPDRCDGYFFAFFLVAFFLLPPQHFFAMGFSFPLRLTAPRRDARRVFPSRPVTQRSSTFVRSQSKSIDFVVKSPDSCHFHPLCTGFHLDVSASGVERWANCSTIRHRPEVGNVRRRLIRSCRSPTWKGLLLSS